MDADLNVEVLLLRIIIALVDDPNEVHVTSLTTEFGTVFQVTVALPDVGKIIGKDGRTARLLRVLMSAMGVTAKTRYELDVVSKADQSLKTQIKKIRFRRDGDLYLKAISSYTQKRLPSLRAVVLSRA
jgi:predicted RNA-binding protein YlqC (UPF0109 family)